MRSLCPLYTKNTGMPLATVAATALTIAMWKPAIYAQNGQLWHWKIHIAAAVSDAPMKHAEGFSAIPALNSLIAAALL